MRFQQLPRGSRRDLVFSFAQTRRRNSENIKAAESLAGIMFVSLGRYEIGSALMEHPLRTLLYELFVEPILRAVYWILTLGSSQSNS